MWASKHLFDKKDLVEFFQCTMMENRFCTTKKSFDGRVILMIANRKRYSEIPNSISRTSFWSEKLDEQFTSTVVHDRSARKWTWRCWQDRMWTGMQDHKRQNNWIKDTKCAEETGIENDTVHWLCYPKLSMKKWIIWWFKYAEPWTRSRNKLSQSDFIVDDVQRYQVYHRFHSQTWRVQHLQNTCRSFL